MVFSNKASRMFCCWVRRRCLDSQVKPNVWQYHSLPTLSRRCKPSLLPAFLFDCDSNGQYCREVDSTLMQDKSISSSHVKCFHIDCIKIGFYACSRPLIDFSLRHLFCLIELCRPSARKRPLAVSQNELYSSAPTLDFYPNAFIILTCLACRHRLRVGVLLFESRNMLVSQIIANFLRTKC